MKKWSICCLAVITTHLIGAETKAQEVKVLKTTPLPHYSSASAIEYFHNSIYVIGDDAPDMMVLSKEHKPKQKVRIYGCKDARIDKNFKADLESVVLVNKGRQNFLVGLGSFSTPNRNQVLVYQPQTVAAKGPRLRTFTVDFSSLNLAHKNIEGAAWVSGKIILGNRANNQSKDNYLILSDFDENAGISLEKNKLIKLEFPKSEKVIGLSGLNYIPQKDVLIITASTENVNDAYNDGEIEDSYIGYIEDISKKLENETIALDRLFKVANFLGNDKHFKIESVAVETVNGNDVVMHLAADNDDGKSTLFKLQWTLEKTAVLAKQ